VVLTLLLSVLVLVDEEEEDEKAFEANLCLANIFNVVFFFFVFLSNIFVLSSFDTLLC